MVAASVWREEVLNEAFKASVIGDEEVPESYPTTQGL